MVLHVGAISGVDNGRSSQLFLLMERFFLVVRQHSDVGLNEKEV